MIFPNIVGVAGYARTGKDTFGGILVEELGKIGLRAKKLSLAYELKSDLDCFLSDKFGISAFTEDTKEKNFIRRPYRQTTLIPTEGVKKLTYGHHRKK